MARTRDNRLAQQLVQLIVNNGGEVQSGGQDLRMELAMALMTDAETINSELLYLRRKSVIMTDRQRDGNYYGIYLLPGWDRAMAEIMASHEVRVVGQPVEPEINLTEPEIEVEPVVARTAEDEIDYARLAQHMIEQAGVAIEKGRRADEIMPRYQELLVENEKLEAAVTAEGSALAKAVAELDTLRQQMANVSSDNLMIQALTVGLEAAKEEVKRLRNELITTQNEVHSLENANRSLSRELRYAKANSGGPLARRLRPETLDAMNQLKRDLEEE